MKQSARNLMQRLLGSVHSPILSWRDMWVIVSSHKEGHSWCEQLSPSPNFRSWGPSLTLTCQVPLVSFSQGFTLLLLLLYNINNNNAFIIDSECQDQWDPTEENQRRREFCSRVEGYGSVCHCELPAPISFQPIQVIQYLNAKDNVGVVGKTFFFIKLRSPLISIQEHSLNM